MAKISKKPPYPQQEATEKGNPLRFLMEGLDDASERCGMEPINHTPYVDMYSTSKEVVVEVEMPGVRHEDIEVTILENTLNIKAMKYECFEEENVNYVCLERSFGRIFRAIDIPLPVNTGEIKATYRKGILRIAIPRVEEKRGKPKRVPIESL